MASTTTKGIGPLPHVHVTRRRNYRWGAPTLFAFAAIGAAALAIGGIYLAPLLGLALIVVLVAWAWHRTVARRKRETVTEIDTTGHLGR